MLRDEPDRTEYLGIEWNILRGNAVLPANKTENNTAHLLQTKSQGISEF